MDLENQLFLMDSWDFPMLCALGMFSPQGKLVAAHGLRQARERFLMRWMSSASTDAFLKAMRSSDTVIAGAACLHFTLPRADRTTWDPPMLELICPANTFHGMCTFIEDRLYAREVPLEAEDTLPSATSRLQPLEHVHRRKYFRTTKGGLLHVMATNLGVSPLRLVTYANATHLFTFLTADALCVAYPSGLIGRDTVRSGRTSGLYPVEEVSPYRAKGFTFHPTVGAWLATWSTVDHADVDEFCPCTKRYFGDRDSLTIAFNADETAPFGSSFSTNASACWTATWVLGGKACGFGTCVVDAEAMSTDIIIIAEERIPGLIQWTY